MKKTIAVCGSDANREFCLKVFTGIPIQTVALLLFEDV